MTRKFLKLVFLITILTVKIIGTEKKIGLCVMATGRYNTFAHQMIHSARQFFLKGNHVTYFIFTDGDVEEADDIKKVHQSRLGWPYDTMMRFEAYLKNQDLFEGYDYLFALDADMLFVSDVGDEILGDLVGTIHPGYYNQRGTYETRKKSTACVRAREGQYYFAGGFYGGSREEFLKLLAITSKNINIDLSHKFIAVWHDESHLNRYFIDHPPTLKLDPSYCYPENWQIPFSRKLLALDKNHAEMRQ